MTSEEVFRQIKVGLAYAEFVSSDVAGALFKLIDNIETDVADVYKPTPSTENAANHLQDMIEDFLSDEEDDEDIITVDITEMVDVEEDEDEDEDAIETPYIEDEDEEDDEDDPFITPGKVEDDEDDKD